MHHLIGKVNNLEIKLFFTITKRTWYNIANA
jgi:hypothetical protein